jgi:hypothetical protein
MENGEEEKVILELTKSEALVLFDWLAETSDKEWLDAADPAIRRVLWGLECLLERNLVEPFRPNYAELLAQAKNDLKE